MSRRGGVAWGYAIGAVPVAMLLWVLLTVVLTVVLTDAALGGMVAIGIITAVGAGLLLVRAPAARGSGVGAVVTVIPCAIALALSLL